MRKDLKQAGARVSKSLSELEEYMASLRRKYGPTYTVDCTKAERVHLVSLRKPVDFKKIAVDGTTHD